LQQVLRSFGWWLLLRPGVDLSVAAPLGFIAVVFLVALF
jgi:hypothetical protein